MRISKGFTLIEVLVVIAIIAILATAVIIGISAFQSQARDSRRVSDLHTVQNMLELAYSKNGQYPAAGTGWSGFSTNLATALGGSFSAANVPDDPQSAASTPKHYTYGVNASQTNYVIRAVLENNNGTLLGSAQDLDGTVQSVDCTDATYQLCYGN